MHELALHHSPPPQDAPAGQPGRVRVEYRADGTTQPQTAEVPFAFDFDPKDRRLIQWYLEEYFTSPWGVYKERAALAEKAVRDIGERLFTAVFGPEDARDLYREVRRDLSNTRIVVHATTPLGASLPWEFLYDAKLDPAGALAQQAHSFIRSRPNVPRTPWDATGKGPLNVLLVICRPAGPDKDVPFQSVARPVVDMLGREEMKDRVSLTVLRPPTFLRLSQELLAHPGKYHVVHFDGHGTFPDLPPGLAATPGTQFFNHPALQGRLAFEDEDPKAEKSRLVTGADLGAVLAQAKVPVVLLNACQSGKEQEASAYPSVGNQLLDAGARGVVAMAFSVLVESAKQFMKRLYEGLLNGEELGHAVQLARADLSAAPRRHGSPVGPLDLRDWMVPVVLQTGDVTLARPRKSHLALSLDPPATDAAGHEHGCPEPPAFGLVGRDGVMLELERAFRSDTLVLLEGMAGIGKTEAAVGFARWLARTGGLDGPVFFHSFGTHTTLDQVVGEIGRAFNATIKKLTRADWGQITDADQRRGLVRQLLRQVPCLLIWDNVEPVAGFPAGTTSDWSAEEQQELRTFLHDLRGGATHVLLTSRRDETAWIGRDVFRKVELRGLPKAEAEELAEKVLTRAGVSMAGLEDYTALLAYLQGNPLALQAILPELKTRKPADLLRDLQSGEANLSADDPALGRQRSLAASLGYRLDKLDPTLRQKLGVLALFQGFVDADILGWMGKEDGAPEAIRGQAREQWDAVLSRAAEVGLLKRIGEGYYTVHPAVPWFLSDLLDEALPGQRPALESAYCTTYAGYSEWLVKSLGTNAETAITLLRAESGNLRHALTLTERRQDWDSANGILYALNRLMPLDGRWAEWDKTLTRFEGLATDPADPKSGPQVGRERLWRSVLGFRARYAERHEIAQAARLYERLLEEYRRQGDERNEAVALHQLGMVAQERGEWGEAERWYRESLGIMERLGDDRGRAGTLHQLGNAAYLRGELGEAERWYRETLGIMERLGDDHGRAGTLHQLGMVAQNRGELGEAERWYRESLGIMERLGDDRGRAQSLHQLGMVAQERGEWEEAERWYRESLGIEERLGDDHGRAQSLGQLGNLALIRRDLGAAERWYRESLGIMERLGDDRGRAGMLHQLGRVSEDRGQVSEATALFRQAEQILERTGDARNLQIARNSLKRVQPS